MNRHALHHCGLDSHGNRHWRLKTATAARNCRQHAMLFPRVVVVTPLAAGRVVWRNGLQQRRWHAVAAQVRADRCSFLTTLPRQALVPPIPPRFR